MATVSDLRRLVSVLPEVETGADADDVNATVGGRALCWTYLARETPKAKRVRVEGVVAIRTTAEAKEMLITTAPARFFTDDHYRGYPAMLARLEAIDVDELAGLLASAWRASAPKAVAKRSPRMFA